MPLWDKVRQELDRAGRVAQDALDEGRVRLEAFRARQHADRSAQALGYALFRARTAGSDLDAQAYERLSATLTRHEAEATRLETQLDEIQDRRRSGYPDDGTTTSVDTVPGSGGSAAPTVDAVVPTDTGLR